ncbi:MAG: glycosyltransferase [Phenylobacterium sp.]|uniref:glycosyltransferase family 2 protein n=1 Tax=Phenylobacterium sp. TaxID=1871053 RepID=UPI002732F09B|nr:glycosyltransferase [Phenylobacterium sp.]MDP3747237.1 glycosyltransferase [Phenylobacterium sp.]
MSAAPKVSVVIPHYRDLAGLDLCLRALAAQTYPAADFEVIVADNNSPEGEAAVAEVIAGRARLVVVTEKGAGPARNGGVALARGDILAFTDSDCVPEPAWLTEGLAALPAYDFIGGRVTVLVDDLTAMSGPEAFERVFAFDFKTYIEKKGFTGAGNLFCARAVFDKVGGFRAAVSEDVEWSFRARGMGLRLGYAPRAVVGHPARRTWDELWAKWRRVNAETYRLYRERPAGRLIWVARSLALPLSALAHTPKVFASDQLTSLSQRLSALGTLFKLRLWRLGHAFVLMTDGKGA